MSSSDQGSSWSSWGWGLVSTVSATTSRLVADLAEAIEPEEDAQVPQIVPKRDSSTSLRTDRDNQEGEIAKKKEKKDKDGIIIVEEESGKSEKEGNADENKEEQGPTIEDIESDPVLKYIDTGVAFVGGSLEMLGSFLQKGVEKVQNTNMEELTKKGAEMAQKSLQKLEEVGTKTLESLKEELKDVVDVVGETYGIPEEEIDDPTASDDAERTEPKKINEGSEEISYASAFEMANGPNHAKKLEELAMHAMMTSQGIYANLDLNQRQIIAERMAKVSEIFKKEELSEEESKVTYPLLEEFTARLEFFQLTLDGAKKKAEQMESIAQGLATHETDSLTGLRLAQKVYTDAVHTSTLVKSECAKSLAKLSVLAMEFVQPSTFFCGQLSSLCTIDWTGIASFLDWLVKNEKVERLLFTTVYLRLICEKLEADIGEATSLYIEALKTLYNLSRALITKTGTEEETAQLRKELQTKINNARNAMLIDSGSSVAHLQTCKKSSLSVAKYLIFIAFKKREEMARQQAQAHSQPAQPQSPTQSETPTKSTSPSQSLSTPPASPQTDTSILYPPTSPAQTQSKENDS